MTEVPDEVRVALLENEVRELAVTCANQRGKIAFLEATLEGITQSESDGSLISFLDSLDPGALEDKVLNSHMDLGTSMGQMFVNAIKEVARGTEAESGASSS